MEEKRGLRWLIQQEGKYFEWKDVPEDVRAVARQYGYEEGMILVLTLYKPAYRCRDAPNGTNLNDGSLQGFRAFIHACGDTANTVANPVIKALLFHNAGSASARHNGNTGQQEDFNCSAVVALNQMLPEERDDDWRAVYEKVSISMYECGVAEMNETDFRSIIASMSGRSKDEAGRREFLARWLDTRGRHKDAVKILKLVETDTTSDPAQRNSALELLKKLTSSA